MSTIPYHTIPLQSDEPVNYKCTGYKLPDGRAIRVGYDKADKSRIIVINRPLENGDTSELKFAISKEGAHLLATVLLEVEEMEKRDTLEENWEAL